MPSTTYIFFPVAIRNLIYIPPSFPMRHANYGTSSTAVLQGVNEFRGSSLERLRQWTILRRESVHDTGIHNFFIILF